MTDRDFAVAESICRDEGMTATRSAAGIRICLPRPVSAHHQVCMVATLWEVWSAARNEVSIDKADWIVDVSAMDDLPLPLVAVLSAIQVDLSRVHRNLLLLTARNSSYSEGER